MILFIVPLGNVDGQTSCQTAMSIFYSSNCDQKFLMSESDKCIYLSFTAELDSVNLVLAYEDSCAGSVYVYENNCNSLPIHISPLSNVISLSGLTKDNEYFVKILKSNSSTFSFYAYLKNAMSYYPNQIFLEPNDYSPCCGQTLHITLNTTQTDNSIFSHEGCMRLFYSVNGSASDLNGLWYHITDITFPPGQVDVYWTPPCVNPDPYFANQGIDYYYLGYTWVEKDNSDCNPTNMCAFYGTYSNPQAIQVINPQISISATPNPICIGECSNLTASGGVSYNWSTGQNSNPITVCPQAATNYNVTGTDSYGCTGTSSKTIIVDYPKPDFTVSPNPVCLGNAINFFDESTCEESIVSWFWQFGDGSSATGQNTYHYYTSSGAFQVTLTVTDSYGNTYTKTRTVTVRPQPDHIVLSGVFNDCEESKIYYTIDNAYMYDSYFSWEIPAGSGIFFNNHQNTTTSSNTTQIIMWTTPLTQPAPIIITACDKYGCCITDTFYVYPCCDKNIDLVFNDTPITGFSSGIVNGESIVINGTCEIPSTIEFQNCTFLMGGGAKLEIPDGVSATFTTCNIAQCNRYMWEGIYLLTQNSEVIIQSNTVIKDAMKAVVSNSCGKYKILNSTFDLNYRNIVVNQCDQILLNEIHGSTFTCSNSSFMLFPHQGKRTYSAIEANKVRMMHVGQPNNGIIDNTFSNISGGILLTNTSAEIKNNSFSGINIAPFQPNLPAIKVVNSNFGLGTIQSYNMIVGGPNSVDGNIFTNCSKGIDIQYGRRSLIQNNRFSKTMVPVYFAFCSKAAETNVLDNRITNASIGIYAYRNKNSKNTISNNTISWNGSGLMFPVPGTGIKIETFLSNNEIYNVSFNDISRARVGIYTNSVAYSTLRENQIDVVAGSSILHSYGIRTLGGEKLTVYGNSIDGPAQAANYSYGISMSMSGGSRIECNTVEKCHHGLNFDGNMPSEVYRNSMRKNFYGVTFTNGGIIGPQGNTSYPSDNTWKQNTQDGWSFSSYGDQSLFHVRTSLPFQGGNVAAYIPAFSITYYSPYPSNYTAPKCSTDAGGTIQMCQISLPGPSLPLGFKKQVAKDQITYNMFPQSESWQAKKDVYGLLKRDTLFTYLTDTVLTQFVDSMMVSPVETQKSASVLFSNDSVATAQLLNNASAANTLTEQSLKILNNIAFRADTVALAYTSAEISWLQFMAAQCPYEYGPAVYMARAMLAPVDTTVYFNMCELESENNKSAETINEDVYESDIDVSVFPNPANDEFQIYAESTSREGSYCYYITDLSGTVVQQLSKGKYNAVEQVEVSDLSPGVYILCVIEESGLTHNYRLTVIK